MPRVIMGNVEELKHWTERFVNADRYTAYATSRYEAILEPMRSTNPLRYGYIRFTDRVAWQQALTWLKERGLTVLHCHRYEWASDREVGARSPQEPEEGEE